MIRITDQYFWNVVFSLFFVVLVVMMAIILSTEGDFSYTNITLLDLTLITFASWRLTRLFVYDAATKWFREQFWDATRTKGGVELSKPKTGPRRTLADLMSCPWCFSVWASAVVTFFYFLTPLAFYPIVFLAASAVASYLQLLSNLTGHTAELQKQKSERGF